MWMPTGWNVEGGHQVQLQRTAGALEDLGLSVDRWLGESLPDGQWSVIHGFGLRPGDVRLARTRARRVVISTVYWDRGYRHEPGSLGRWWIGRHRLGLALRLGATAVRGPEAGAPIFEFLADRSMALAYEGADLLLPNSSAEAVAIERDLGVTTPSAVVPNAVDEELTTLEAPPVQQRDRVICLGRIEPHKNQLALIRALNSSGLPLHIVGEPHPDHQAYAAACRKEAGPTVRFAGAVHHDSPEFHELLTGARVSVLASWFETTGLANLEAAATGANVVTTDRGYANEYFDGEAWYCNPASPGSIRQAVMAAWRHPGYPGLRDRIRREFTWTACAKATLAAYETALAKPGS